MKNNKGFTLVELIAVIAILALASGLIAARFFGLINSQDDFEYEVIAKDIAESAYVYYDEVQVEDCQSAGVLIDNGYISENQGLLNKYKKSDIENIHFRAYKDYGEKKVDVYKSVEDCTKRENAIGHY